MKIGIFIEDRMGRDVFSILSHKILAGKRVGIHIRQLPRGDLLNAEKVLASIEYEIRQHSDLAKIIVCVDSECTDPTEIDRKAQAVEQKLRHIRRPVKYCIVVHALEGWLMADSTALRQFLGVKRLPFRKTDSICKPKDKLRKLSRNAGRSYLPSRDNLKIAELADIKRISANNSSFAEFCRLIRDRSRSCVPSRGQDRCPL